MREVKEGYEVMRAVFLPGDRQVELRSVQRPAPGDEEVLISLRAAGLCGSDLHMHYRPARAQRRGPIFGLVTNPEVVPGHEAAGVVTECGPRVRGLKPGDRVAVHHMAGCGHCTECRRGWDINCQQRWGVYGLDLPGAMQDYMVARARDCVRVPPSISLDEASYYTCGGGTGYMALKRAGLGIGDSVAVVGLGPVGLAAASFALQSGVKVVGLDPLERRRGFAGQFGAMAVSNPNDADCMTQVRRATGHKGASVVIETSGTAAGRRLALEVSALRGRVVCVGFGDTDNLIDLQATVIQKQLDVRGAWMFSLPDLQDMLDDISSRGISLRALITGRYGIEDAAKAWQAFDRGEPGKTVLHWDDEVPGVPA
jgi:L-iditol 2-dehydrogenase